LEIVTNVEPTNNKGANLLEVLRTRTRPNFTIYRPALVHYTVISNQSNGNYG